MEFLAGLSICTGSPSVLLYRYASPQDGLNIPFLNGTLNPGIVRLALINAKFPTSINQRLYRMAATFNAPPFMPQRGTQSRGQLRRFDNRQSPLNRHQNLMRIPSIRSS